jgi:hypothetical protein
VFQRMSAGEESPLRSALLLEQVAMCLLRMPTLRRRRRRAAFHLILAAQRFGVAGQRRHAVRCFLHAWRVYDGRGWSAIAAHVQLNVARYAYAVGAFNQSLHSMSFMLAGGLSGPPSSAGMAATGWAGTASVQAAAQRELLAEFVRVYRSVVAKAGSASIPLPLIEHNAVQVRQEAKGLNFSFVLRQLCFMELHSHVKSVC